ncbi:MAG: TonB-dependent receptor [Opitutaceae bacterium]|jgi:iron complex outermembrane receptor protein|nr:TonB-dependent receptor [Opitutaceae bacterium]
MNTDKTNLGKTLPALAATGLLLLALGAADARAQQTKGKDDPVVMDSYEVNESAYHDPLALSKPNSTASRLGLTPMGTPASVETLATAFIRATGDTHLANTISRAAGITRVAGAGNAGSAFAARGFLGNGTLASLYDGIRLFSGRGSVTFPFDPWMAERVEILHGPASVLYGDAATGGAINVTPRKPNRDRVRTEARIGFDTDSSFRLALGQGGPLGQYASYRADVSTGNSDTWLERNDTSTTAAAAALRVDPLPNLNLTLSFDYALQKPGGYFGTPLVEGKSLGHLRDHNYNVADNTIEFHDRWTRLDAEWTPSSQITVRNRLYYLNIAREYKNVEYYYDGGLMGMDGYVIRMGAMAIAHDEDQVGDRVDVTIKNELLGRQNTLLVGAEINRVNFDYNEAEDPSFMDFVDALDFDPGLFPATLSPTSQFRSRTTQFSLFAEDRFELTPKLSFVAGLRYDHVNLDKTDRLAAPDSFKRNYDYFNWRVGAVYALTHALSLYGQLATGTDPLGDSLITITTANRQFDLPDSRQIEIGVKNTFWNERAEWTLALYHIEKRDNVSRDAYSYHYIDKQTARGIEGGIGIALAHGVRVHANLAWLHSEYDAFRQVSRATGAVTHLDGKRPPCIPQVTGNLLASWAFHRDWEIGTGLRYAGKTYATSDNNPAYELDAYCVADAHVRWRLTRHATLAVHLSNAFDEDYATLSQGNQVYLGNPRAVSASLEFSF